MAAGTEPSAHHAAKSSEDGAVTRGAADVPSVRDDGKQPVDDTRRPAKKRRADSYSEEEEEEEDPPRRARRKLNYPGTFPFERTATGLNLCSLHT